MKRTQEQKLLEVKEGLDYFRLPTVFPVESTDLLSQLLALLRKQNNRGKENLNNSNQDGNSEIDSALRHQIGKVTKENNKLHLELMSAKEQIQSMQYSMEKHLLERKGGKEEMKELLDVNRRREDQLFEELTQVKYKYNELMDIVHEDPNIEKQYVKRLMKHKRMEVPSKIARNDGSQKKSQKGQSQTVTELEAKVILVSNKLANRESQITRLQKKMEYDGLNLNKILKDFQKSRVDSKVSVLEEQVRYLEEENQKMKAEVDRCRKTGGRHEALREEVRKNHETIAKISADNAELQRKLKEKEFDCSLKEKEGHRKVHKAENIAQQANTNSYLDSLTIKDLTKKCQFLTNQLREAKEEIERIQTSNLDKDIVIDQMKNAQEGGKVLSQYELETVKQKLLESDATVLQQREQIVKLMGENRYFKDEGLLKSEAIQNLEKIVDELMRKNHYQRSNVEDVVSETQAIHYENILTLRKNVSDLKHALALAEGDKIRIEKDLNSSLNRLEQKVKENVQLTDEANRLKIRVMEMKSDFEEALNLQKKVEKLELDVRRQQNGRMKAESMLEQSENERAKLRRELQQVTQEFEIYEKKAKNHMNSQKLETVELDEVNQLMDIRIRDKDRKIADHEDKIQELQNKNKLLKDEVTLLEDEKHAIFREKHRIEKRLEEMLRMQAQISDKDGNADAVILKREIGKLEQKNEHQKQHISELTNVCESWTKERQALVSEKIGLIRENDTLKQELNKLERLLINERQS